MKTTHDVSSIAGKAVLIYGGSQEQRLSYIEVLINDLLQKYQSKILRETLDVSEKNIGIDAIRNLVQKSNYTSLSNSLTVFTLLNADNLSHLVQNVLLKTLEEVSNKHVFILEASTSEGVLLTIRSRTFLLPILEEEGSSEELFSVETLYTKTLPELFGIAEEYSDSPERAKGLIKSLLIYMREQFLMRRTDSTYINYTEFLVTSYGQVGSINVSVRLVLENCLFNFYSIFRKI